MIRSFNTIYHGSARNVIDYIEYHMLLDEIIPLCDSLSTALVAIGPWLNGNASARRGRELT